jgi:hypothetical protein
MKRLDMTGVCVVYAGEIWGHGMPPCNREMVPFLERNERLVSWLQPANGSVHDQMPAIRVNDAFYTISLRMMKAIWRHVRLRKGFDNVEKSPYGGLKLKIPVALLAEKLRTQSRFNVSLSRLSVCAMRLLRIYYLHWVSQVMRMSAPAKERKISQSAPSKIDSIVRQLFVPMLGMPTPPHTSFVPEDCEEALLRQVAQDKPESMGSEDTFIECMVQLYRKFQGGSAAPVGVGSVGCV